MSCRAANAEREAVLDALLDLQHDLGKHIRLPVAMLPSDAPPEDVRAALEQALFRTRTSAAGTQGARDLWRRFLAETRDGVGIDLGALRAAVAAALAWESALAAGKPLPGRDELLADLDRVGHETRRLVAEVRHAR